MKNRRMAILTFFSVSLLLTAIMMLGSRIGKLWHASLHTSASVGTQASNSDANTLGQDASAPSNPTSIALPNFVQVSRVIDGDTIIVNGHTTVRLVGIDTPETVDPRRPVACYGREASDFMKKLLTGQTIRLEKDVTDKDKYGRLLRFVFLETGSGEIFVDNYLVKMGYARAYPFPPDLGYQDLLLSSQAEARTADRGLWQACPNNSAFKSSSINR